MAAALVMGGLGVVAIGCAVVFDSTPRRKRVSKTPSKEPVVIVDLDDIAHPFGEGMGWAPPSVFVDAGRSLWIRYDRAREGRVDVVKLESIGADGVARPPCAVAKAPVQRGGEDFVQVDWGPGTEGCVTHLVFVSRERGSLDVTIEVPAVDTGVVVGLRPAPVRPGDQDALVVVRPGETRTVHLGRIGGEVLVVLPPGEYACELGAGSVADAVILDVDEREQEVVASWFVSSPGPAHLVHRRWGDGSAMIAHVYAARSGRGS